MCPHMTTMAHNFQFPLPFSYRDVEFLHLRFLGFMLYSQVLFRSISPQFQKPDSTTFSWTSNLEAPAMSAKTSSQVTAESKAGLPEPHYHTSERNRGHPQILPQPMHQINFFSNIFWSRNKIPLQTLTLLPILSHSPRILTCLFPRCSQNWDLLEMASLLFRGTLPICVHQS